MSIKQNIPTLSNNESKYLEEILHNPSLLNNRHYSSLCESWLENNQFKKAKVLLTTSGTRALEMVSMLLDFRDGDEIILPSYTFVGSVNPFVLNGAVPVFVDILPGTLNISPSLIEKAITHKTKAILAVNYAGVGAELDEIIDISKRHNLMLIEDNAQGFLSKYKNKYLGTFGDFSILSFNYTKNIQCGEGGAVIINNTDYIKKAEMFYHLGTNRIEFEKKQTSFYEWKSIGSKFYPSQLDAAFLYPQLLMSDKILTKRLSDWQYYYESISALKKAMQHIKLPDIPKYCQHNGHIFYVLLKDHSKLKDFIHYLSNHKINTSTHYTPLHNSEFGKKTGRLVGTSKMSVQVSKSLVRLPLFYSITLPEIDNVVDYINKYFLQFD